MLSDNKPLPDPKLTQTYVTTMRWELYFVVDSYRNLFKQVSRKSIGLKKHKKIISSTDMAYSQCVQSLPIWLQICSLKVLFDMKKVVQQLIKRTPTKMHSGKVRNRKIIKKFSKAKTSWIWTHIFIAIRMEESGVTGVGVPTGCQVNTV